MKVRDKRFGLLREPTLFFREALGASDCKSERREIRTPNLLIWSQTRYRCAIHPMLAIMSTTDQPPSAVVLLAAETHDANRFTGSECRPCAGPLGLMDKASDF